MSLVSQHATNSTPTHFSATLLRDALNSIVADNDFADHHVIKKKRDPQIVVEGVGRIGIPLREEQAQQIISKAHQVPVGLGGEEVVRTTARNNWELDPRDFKITAGTRWDEVLDDVLSTVSKKLGVTAPIQANLYKMLLCGRGATYKASTYEDNSPNVFGTLLINLPSFHEGGNVTVRYLDKKKVLSTSSYSMSCAFWFSNLSHKVLPVKSGYRWVLVYNLVTALMAEKSPGCVPHMDNKILSELMEKWVRGEQTNSTTPLYCALVEKYPTLNPSWADLKSRDRARADKLLHACRRLDFELFFATLEREEHFVDRTYYYNLKALEEVDYDWEDSEQEESESDDDANDSTESTVRVKSVYDLSGKEIISSSSSSIYACVDEEDILQEDAFGEDPDDTDEEDFPEFEEIVRTRWYRVPALAIVPPKAVPRFLTSAKSIGTNPKCDPNLLTCCINRWQSSDNESALQVLLCLLQKMSSESRQPPWATNKDFAVRLYKLAMTCDSPRLMGWVVCHILPLPSTLLEWSQKQFEMSTISFERLRAGFTYLLRTQKSLCIKYHAIIALQGDTEPNGQLLELLKDAATHSISNWGETFPSYENGVALFDLTQYSDNCLEVIKSSIVPGLAGASGRLTDFTMGFVSRLHQGMQRKQVPEAEAKSIYEGLVRATIRNMSITLLTVEETHIDGQLRDDTISYQNLHRFVASLFQPGLESQRDMFVEKVSFEAMHISDRTKFEALWIPLLQDLLSACEKLKISLSDRRWQAFYQAILECFLRGYVGKSVPKLQPSLISKTVSCLCRECRDLNKFLVHPLQKEYRVHKSDRRMSHFQQELHDIRKYCITKPDPSDSYCVLLTKTGWQDDSKKRARKQRKIEAAKHLHAFDQKKLRAVLADRYDAIITMSMLKRPKNPTTTTSRAPSSTQAREPLAPISANPAQEMARIEAEMDRLVNGRPPMAPAPAKSNVTIHTQPFTTVPPNQTRFMNTAPRPAYTAPVFGMPAYEFQPPLTPMPAPNAVGPAPMYPTTPQYGGVADHVFSTPYMPTWQHPTTSYMPGNTQTAPPVMAANRSVSNASRPPPSKMIPHPVAGAKRKMVELIDLTLDDD